MFNMLCSKQDGTIFFCQLLVSQDECEIVKEMLSWVRMLYRVFWRECLASLGRANVRTEKINIVEDNVLVLKLVSAPVLNIKKFTADCLAAIGLSKKLSFQRKWRTSKRGAYLVFYEMYKGNFFICS